MDLTTGKVSNELVGGEVPKPIRAMIEAAKQAPADAKGSMLWAAQQLDPTALPIYYLLYKLHASRGELEPAERAARLGLAESGRQAGLPVTVDAADGGHGTAGESVGEVSIPQGVAFDEGAARFWLFTLKALVFISVRSGALPAAQRYLALLQRCDPTHSVGGDVTAALVQSAVERG